MQYFSCNNRITFMSLIMDKLQLSIIEKASLLLIVFLHLCAIMLFRLDWKYYPSYGHWKFATFLSVMSFCSLTLLLFGLQADILVVLVGMTYSNINPVILPFFLGYLVLGYVTNRYLLFYVYKQVCLLSNTSINFEIAFPTRICSSFILILSWNHQYRYCEFRWVYRHVRYFQC